MTLTHIPARTTFSPDRFIDEETGREYIVRQDTDAQDPRAEFEAEDAALWAYREPALRHSVGAEKPEGNIAIDAFADFYETAGDAEVALERTRTYLAELYPGAKLSIAIKTIRGDSQGDWLDVVAATREGSGIPEILIDRFRMWAFGEVWVVIPDGKPGICNIYAEGPEEALKHFRTHFEDTVFHHKVELLITAETPAESLEKLDAIIIAIHDSHALPRGVRVQSFTNPKIT